MIPVARSSGRFICLLLSLTVLAGCHKPAQSKSTVSTRPRVALVSPAKRTLERSVGQPSYVYAYEQTSLYPKVSGFIQKWYVDIGDSIKKGQPICDIYVPELTAELEQKKALVAQQEVNVKLAEQMVSVAQQYQAAAAAQIKEAQANVKKYAASVERWESEVKRLGGLASERVIDQQVLTETRKQLKADQASQEAAQATTSAAEATERARAADVEKAKVDVDASRAKVVVDKAAEQRLAALVSYTHITAPYDGTVVVRNANTWDYVQPGSGDLSASAPAWDESTNRGAPIYVVARTDQVRIYIDVPETEASYVTVKTPAKVMFPALAGEEIDAPVTRTSWSLNTRSRTLRAEVDLPNPDRRLLPGMYAYGRVLIKRPDVWAVPLECVVAQGNQNVCYLYDHGKALLTPVQTGINDGTWIELVRKQVGGSWAPFTGSEELIKGDLGELANEQAVEAPPPAAPGNGTPARD